MKKSKLTGFYLCPKGEAYIIGTHAKPQKVQVSFTDRNGKVLDWATTKADASFMIRMEKLKKIGEV